MIRGMPLPAHLDRLNADELRCLLIASQARIDKLTYELAYYKRQRYGVKAEHLSAEQAQLFEETTAADLAAIGEELERLSSSPAKEKDHPKRKPLPAELPRTEIHHEPESTTCACGCQMKRIGEDIAEKLDYTPGTFTVERHIRGKWACSQCATLVQAPVPAHVIDKGIPTTGLLAQVLIAKYLDHLPLYRQESIFGRAGLAIPQSTLAQWVGQMGVVLQPLVNALKDEMLAHPVLHADETPVAMLDPGAGKTRKAYVWGYARGEFDARPGVVYEFCPGRGAKYPVEFLKGWNGTLVCDDYKAYETVFKLGQRIEAGCLVHARRKFDELIKHGHSEVAAEAVRRLAWVFKVEHDAREARAEERLALRQQRSQAHWDGLHAWMRRERERVPDGSGIARALDYSLNRWQALSRFLRDGEVSCHNNHLENRLRPWAMGRKAWLFAGSELAGQRAAIVMSLVQSARLHGHDPWVYLKDVLERLPMHLNSRIEELLPHRWQAPAER